jgi:hypothetical protein
MGIVDSHGDHTSDITVECCIGRRRVVDKSTNEVTFREIELSKPTDGEESHWPLTESLSEQLCDVYATHTQVAIDRTQVWNERFTFNYYQRYKYIIYDHQKYAIGDMIGYMTTPSAQMYQQMVKAAQARDRRKKKKSKTSETLQPDVQQEMFAAITNIIVHKGNNENAYVL